MTNNNLKAYLKPEIEMGEYPLDYSICTVSAEQSTIGDLGSVDYGEI